MDRPDNLIVESQVSSQPPLIKPVENHPQHTPVTPIILAVIVTGLISVFATAYFLKPELFRAASNNKTEKISISPTVMPTINPVANWLTYTNNEAGFSLKYPPDISLSKESKGATKPTLSISVEPISKIDPEMPLNLGRKDAIADREALVKSNLTHPSFSTKDELMNLGSLNGRISTYLAMFEVCDVRFDRTLVFYPGDYRVTIDFTGVNSDIIAGMPDFFKPDNVNCQHNLVWNADKMENFLSALSAHKGRGAGQVWYDTFDNIVKTIEINPVITTSPLGAKSTPTPVLFSVPSNWKKYQNQGSTFSFEYPPDWIVTSEDFPQNQQRLIKLAKKDTPTTVAISFSILKSWDNTSMDGASPFIVGNNIIAKRIDPAPKNPNQYEQRYQTNVTFEHGDDKFFFVCTHNWNQDYLSTCNNILKTVGF
jgi:hypothetical protein